MSKPVIFIPGYPGSELYIRGGRKLFLSLPDLAPVPNPAVLKLLEGPDDLATDDRVDAGPPIGRLARFILLDLAKQAESLYEVLARIDVNPVKFGYDWRRPIWDSGTQTRLANAVSRLHDDSGRKIVGIVHSTGGLVLRYLLENTPGVADLFERVIAFGVPWAGLLKTLRFLDGRERFITVGHRRAQRLIANSWAAYDLLPPDPAKTDMRDADGNRLNLVLDGTGAQTSPLVKQAWFDPGLRSDMVRRAEKADEKLGTRSPMLQTGGTDVAVTNVVGWGTETLVQATIRGSGNDQRITAWKRVTEPGDLDGGDGTVPFRSASWLRGDRVVRYHVPVGFHQGARRHPHSSLWRNPGGRNLLRHLLAGKRLQPFVYAAVDTDDFLASSRAHVRVRLSTLDDLGQPLSGVHVRATDLRPGSAVQMELEPGDGRHRITVPRARMIRVFQNKFRRFTLRIRWDGGSVDRHLLVSEQVP